MLVGGLVIFEFVRNWFEGGVRFRGGVDWYRDFVFIMVRFLYSRFVKEEFILNLIFVFYKKFVFEDIGIECGEWERFSCGNLEGFVLLLDNKDGLYYKYGL